MKAREGEETKLISADLGSDLKQASQSPHLTNNPSSKFKLSFQIHGGSNFLESIGNLVKLGISCATNP